MEVGSSVSLVDLLPGASDLPAELVGELDRESAVRDVAAGTVLLRQRAVVEDLIVLVRGRIAISEHVGVGRANDVGKALREFIGTDLPKVLQGGRRRSVGLEQIEQFERLQRSRRRCIP